MATNAVELTPSTYGEFIKNEYVLVDVWAPWCGPCRQISPIVDQISLEFMEQLQVGKLNADENRDISPLRRADDAIILDNSRMTVDEQMLWVKQMIEKKRDGS